MCRSSPTTRSPPVARSRLPARHLRGAALHRRRSPSASSHDLRPPPCDTNSSNSVTSSAPTSSDEPDLALLVFQNAFAARWATATADAQLTNPANPESGGASTVTYARKSAPSNRRCGARWRPRWRGLRDDDVCLRSLLIAVRTRQPTRSARVTAAEDAGAAGCLGHGHCPRPTGLTGAVDRRGLAPAAKAGPATRSALWSGWHSRPDQRARDRGSGIVAALRPVQDVAFPAGLGVERVLVVDDDGVVGRLGPYLGSIGVCRLHQERLLVCGGPALDQI